MLDALGRMVCHTSSFRRGRLPVSRRTQPKSKQQSGNHHLHTSRHREVLVVCL